MKPVTQLGYNLIFNSSRLNLLFLIHLVVEEKKNCFKPFSPFWGEYLKYIVTNRMLFNYNHKWFY